MQGGGKGLLVNSKNICASTNRSLAESWLRPTSSTGRLRMKVR